MKFHQGKSPHRRITYIISITLPAAFLAGCSTDEQARNYTTPHSLCGIEVDSRELTPFLPPGESIGTEKENLSGVTACKVTVDDTLILTTTQAWLAKGRTTAYFALSQTVEEVSFSADGDRFRYSGNEGFGKTKNCVDEVYEQELYAAVQASGSAHRDPDSMKRLIVSYTAEVENSPECTASAL